MRVTQLGDFTLAEEEYVKIGNRVIECGWIKSIGYHERGGCTVIYGGGASERFDLDSPAFEDVKALYEFRLALALKNEPEEA